MKRLMIIVMSSLALVSCAPVLNRGLMDQGLRDVPLSSVRQTPDAYKGKLFILGGIIVDTKLTENGTQIEVLSIPVNRYGYLKDEIREGEGRFLAVYPREQGFLEPMIYKKGRQITLAGEFLEVRKAKLDEIEYSYPVFEIKQIYLWEEYRDYYYPYYYYPYYSYPYWWYDPWWRPYPYWGPYGPPPGW
jgi:outer membrane lipoprotein